MSLRIVFATALLFCLLLNYQAQSKTLQAENPADTIPTEDRVELTTPEPEEMASPATGMTAFLDDILVNRQKERNPSIAALFSAVIPGAGQTYNGEYLKVGVIYGITGGLLYALDFNRHQYKRFNAAYEQRLKGEQDEFAGIIPNARGIRNIRDNYRKDMELTYIGLGLTYLFNVIDAFVAAHLASFDIDDDLSMQLRPTVIPGPHVSNAGVGLVLRF